MKTILYVVLVLFMGSNFISCTPEQIIDNTELQDDTVGEEENDPAEEGEDG